MAEQLLNAILKVIFSKSFFWLIMALLFFILWRKNKRISDKFEKNKKKINEFSRAQTETGRMVFLSNQQKIMEIFAETISDTSKVSGFGSFISIVAAVFSIFVK